MVRLSALAATVIAAATIGIVAAAGTSALDQSQAVFFGQRAERYNITIAVQLPGQPYVDCLVAVDKEAIVSAVSAGAELDPQSLVRRHLLSVEALFDGLQRRQYAATAFDPTFGFPLQVASTMSGSGAAFKLSNFVKTLASFERDQLFAVWSASWDLWAAWVPPEYHYRYTPPSFYATAADAPAERIVNVQHGRVVSVLRGDNKHEITAAGEKSLEDWFLEAKRALNEAKLNGMQLTYDPNRGFPTVIRYIPRLTTFTSDLPTYRMADPQPGLLSASTPLHPALIVLAVVACLLIVVVIAGTVLYLLGFPPAKVWAWYLSTPLACWCCCIPRTGKNRYNPRFVANLRLPGNDPASGDDADDLHNDDDDADVELNEVHESVSKQQGLARPPGMDADAFSTLPPHMQRHRKYISAQPAVHYGDRLAPAVAAGPASGHPPAAVAVPPEAGEEGGSERGASARVDASKDMSPPPASKATLPPMPQLPPVPVPEPDHSV